MELHWKLILFVSGIVCVPATVVNIGCDPSWLIQGDSCYLINDQNRVTWNEALAECNRYDASPMFFETAADMTWYKTMAQTHSPAAYWTSMNDIANNDPTAPGTGHWVWGMREYVNSSIVQWSSSPVNDGHAACGGVNQQGNMYDGDCTSKQGYICMIDNGVANGGCPIGWLNTDTDCYYVSNTTDPAQLLTWKDAAAKCAQTTNAHLFVLDDVNDQAFLENQLPYLSLTTYLHWTGLQGSGQAGGWKWNNGATLNQQLFSWAVEPDSVAGKENCAVVRRNGMFSDRGCSMKQNYICRKPQLTQDTSWNLGCGLWIRAGQKCYQFFTQPVSSWQTAKADCQATQGDLINVNSVDVREWLMQQMLDPSNAHIYWTALNDRDTEGSYKWGDGSSLDPTTITWNQEPNDWMGNEDCAVINVYGQYNDVVCTSKHVPLCEVDNVPSCPTTATGGTWVSRTADSGTGNNCYLFGSYTNTSQLKTQKEASDFCSSLSFRRTNPAGLVTQSFVPKLFSVNTQAEATFIATQLKNYQNNPYGYWSSLNDLQTEGFWMFGTDMNTDTSFVTWDTEPHNGTPDTDCVAVATGANYYVKKCGFKYPFICERPVNAPWTSGSAPLVTGYLLLPISIVIRYLH